MACRKNSYKNKYKHENSWGWNSLQMYAHNIDDNFSRGKISTAITFLAQFVQSLACSRLSNSGEDVKEKGMRKVGGAGKSKKEGKPLLSPVSSRFIFVFADSTISEPGTGYSKLS